MADRPERSNDQPVPQSSDDDEPASLPPQLVAQISAQIEQSASFSGPIPPPAALRQYDEVVPGSAERILKMAEDQANHRMHLEKTVVTGDTWRSNAGLVAGLVVALGGLAAAFFMVDRGNEVAGIVLGGLDLTGLVGAFIYGTVSSRQERKERVAVMTGQDKPDK